MENNKNWESDEEFMKSSTDVGDDEEIMNRNKKSNGKKKKWFKK